MKIRFTPGARAEFLEALEFIRQEDPHAAKAFRQRTKSVLNRLSSFPQSGRVIPEFSDLPHREVIIPPYRFFYRAHDKIIWIVAVWHDRRLPQEPELTEPLSE